MAAGHAAAAPSETQQTEKKEDSPEAKPATEIKALF